MSVVDRCVTMAVLKLRLVLAGTMLTKAYSSLVLAVDILVVLLRMVVILLEAIYRLVVPLPEKSLKDELVLVSITLNKGRALL